MFSGLMSNPMDLYFSEVCLATKTKLDTDFQINMIRFHRFMALNRDPIFDVLEVLFERLWLPNGKPLNIFTPLGR